MEENIKELAMGVVVMFVGIVVLWFCALLS